MKYAVTHVSSTEDIYGYSAVAIPLTKENHIEIKRIRALINAVKVLGAEISTIEIITPKITAYALNDEFDANENDEVECLEFTQEEFEGFTDFSDNSYKVDSPTLSVGLDGFSLTYYSKYTSDNIMAEFSFNAIEKMFE